MLGATPTIAMLNETSAAAGGGLLLPLQPPRVGTERAAWWLRGCARHTVRDFHDEANHASKGGFGQVES